MTLTQVADIITPQIFTPFVQQLTEQKARLVQSGVISRSPLLDELLGGGGLTFNVPSFQDLDASDGTSAENVSGDAAADVQTLAAGAGTTLAAQADARPLKTATSQEIVVRMSRNQSWSTADLASALAGADPQESIASRVAFYWTRRLQRIFVRTITGILADNDANDSGDYTNDIKGASFVDGVTNFSAEAFLDAALTMGDSMEDLTAVMVHSIVFNRMQKNNLIDFIPDATGQIQIPTFLGREVIVDDGVPFAAGVHETWLFGTGSMQLGVSTPKIATEVHREPLAGNGGGQEVLTNRVEWSLHPTGHAFTASGVGSGGPTDAEIVLATTWDRVLPERKQIKFARLVTRES